MRSRHVVLSGCSGGGKSTLLAELAHRGFATVPEPGRRIVEAELKGDRAALPWVDLCAFAHTAIEMAALDRTKMAAEPSWVFFDRGLVDAAVALRHAGGAPVRDLLSRYDRYHRTVFMAPPWPEIYASDDARPHDLSEAIAEYERLLIAYRAMDYDTVLLPKTSVGLRADFLLEHLGISTDSVL